MPAKAKTSDLPGGAGKVSCSAGRLYTLPALTVRHIYLLALAILVTVFVSLYPYLGAMEMCNSGECPYATQSSMQSQVGSAGLCLSAVLAVSSVGLLAFAVRRERRLFDKHSRPAQFFTSPDLPHPQFCLSQ